MATRSNIGIVNEDGSVTGIYCHYDGYPENNGKLLLNHYNTPGIVCELMDLGNLSYLAENLYSDNNSHSFKNPVDGVCVAYGRDRGEKGEESKVFNNISEFEKYGNDSAADYQYLFNNGKWTYREFRSDDWSVLTLDDCRY